MSDLGKQGPLESYFPFIVAQQALDELRAAYFAVTGPPKPIEKN